MQQQRVAVAMPVKRRKSKERETFSLLLLLLRARFSDRGNGGTPKEGRIKRALSGSVAFEEYHHPE
jgi:hypothetical protein